MFHEDDHPVLVFNNTIIHKEFVQKQLGLIFDSKRNFKKHNDKNICKDKKRYRNIRKGLSFHTKFSIADNIETFIRTQLDYGDIVYDQPSNASFSDKIELVQYSDVLATTWTIKGI